MSTTAEPVTGVAAGVPFLALPPPDGPAPGAPVVLAWHLMDPPRSEAAFAAALPLAGLAAWRVYLGLPMCGARLPSGGQDEVMALGYADAVMNLQGPIAAQGAGEFPAVLAELRDRFDLTDAPVGLLGGSMGSAIALLVAAETAPAAGITIDAAVAVSPLAQLRPAVEATGRRFGVTYPWNERSLQVADRLDFVARAPDLAAAGQPAVRLVVGAQDDRQGFHEPAERLRDALAGRYDDPSRVDLVVVEGMGHALAAEPGLEPAEQSPHAAVVDNSAVTWFEEHLRHPATRAS